MYQASIPVFIRQLSNLSKVLEKAEAFAASKKIEPQIVTTHSRLAADMFPLNRQIHLATDSAKGAGARLAGMAVPSFPDTETTFPELQERIKKTVEFLQTLTPEQVDGSEDRNISFKVGPNELKFKGQDYLLTFALPNFFFHLTVAYAILRHNGVNLGKLDFLGNF